MPVTRYLYAGPGHLVGETRNGAESLYRHNAMGSTTQLVNSSGSITDTFRFDYFGNSISRTGTTPTPMQWLSDRGTYTPQGGGRSFPTLGWPGPIGGSWSPYDPESGAFLGRWLPPPGLVGVGELIDWLMRQGWFGGEAWITWSTGPGAPIGPFPPIGPPPQPHPDPGSTFYVPQPPKKKSRIVR